MSIQIECACGFTSPIFNSRGEAEQYMLTNHLFSCPDPRGRGEC
jgi:hypothetical protein